MSSAGRIVALVACCGAIAGGLAACGDDDSEGTGGGSEGRLSGTIKIDGSSTVAPLSEAAAEMFQAENEDVRVTVGTSGTGGGFEKFCAGETDISDASRAIEDDEQQACAKNGVEFDEIQVANDGLAVVVNPQNDWAKCLTVAQLKKIWDRGSTVDNWKQVDASFPNEKLVLAGAGTDSGTFDYFTEAVNGEEGRSRSDYAATEDDNVTVQTVTGAKGGMGYFGLSYAEQNPDKVKVVEIDGGDGCVAPSKETVQNGTYKPLSRPLFIYPSKKAVARPEVKAFLEYYVDNEQEIAASALYVDLTDEQAAAAKEKVGALAGT